MTTPPTSTDLPTRRFARTVEWGALLVVLLVLFAVYLRPIWAVRYPPILDYPVHLQMASVMEHLDDPAYGFAEHFERREGLLPYWTTYALIGGLSRLVGIDAAGQLTLSLIALSLVGGALLCLLAFRRSPYLALLALPLFYDVNATYGYLAFRFSIGLALCTVGLLRLDLRRPRLWREALIAAAAVLTYFTHAHGFAFLALWAFFVLLLCAPSLRPALRGAAAGLPALVLAARWYLAAVSTGEGGGKLHTPHLPLIRLAELVPHRLLNSITDNSDEAVMVGLFIAWCALVLSSPRVRGRTLGRRLADHTPELLAGLVLVGYFAVPNQILSPSARIYGINYRFLLPACLLAALVPRLDLRRGRAAALLPLLLLLCYYAEVVHREYVGFDRRYRAFDRVVAAMNPGSTVITYLFNTRDPRFTVPMLGHFAGYYHARRGGAPSQGHTFATYRYMPVKLKDPGALPEPNHRGPNNWPDLLGRYDYLLVVDHPGSRRIPFGDPKLARLVAEGGPFRVYTATSPPPR